MGVRRLDHVGVVVDDLEAASAFFVDLGFERQGTGTVEGEVVDRLNGLDGVRAEVVFLRVPGGGSSTLELSRYHAPSHTGDVHPPPPNRPGIRHLAVVVDDAEAALDAVRRHGADLIGELQDYGSSYRLCYVRGPSGIIVELVQELDAEG